MSIIVIRPVNKIPNELYNVILNQVIWVHLSYEIVTKALIFYKQ